MFPTKFPTNISVEKLGRYGHLTLVMPPPAMIVATKLARAYDSDLEDAVWWMRERGLTSDDIEAVIPLIPQPENQEAARENLIFIKLTARKLES
jgi:hypothetical protein